MKNIYTSIDIGSDTIKFIVGELFNKKVNVLASYNIKSKGIKNGLIIDPNLAINAIKDGIKALQEMLGISINKVMVNVPDYNSKFMLVTGNIKIQNEDKLVTTEDVNKVIKTSVYSKLDQDYELVTVVPLIFNLDNKKKTLYPVGEEASILEIKGIMISTPKKNVYSVVSVIEGAGLEVVDIMVSGLGTYYEVGNSNTDKKVGAIINIGHETTNVSVYKRGKLMNTETLQIGGKNVEKDLAYVFGISIFDARVIKEKFASSHKRFSQLNDTYEVKNTYGEVLKLNQLEVTEVVMSRLAEILNLAKKQISLLTNQEIDYIILTGGQTEIKSFKNLVFEILGKDVIIYSMDTLGVRDNKYTTCLGMIKYFCDKMNIRGKNYSMVSDEDYNLLITPENKTRKEVTIINKIFGSFVNKEEK